MKKLKKFIGYYRPHRMLFFLDMGAALLLALCDMFYPLVTRTMLNDYIQNEKLGMLLIAGGFSVEVLFGLFCDLLWAFDGCSDAERYAQGPVCPFGKYAGGVF